MPKLWPHQERGIHQLRAGFGRGQRHGLLVIPTGGGKSRCAAAMAEAGIARGRRTLFVADRRVLVFQAARAFSEYGLPVGIVMRDAGADWWNPSAPVQVVSKDSLVSWLDRPDFDLPPADLLVVDEAHRGSGPTWNVFRDAYPSAWEVGLTATPVYPNGRGMDTRYQFLVQPTTYAELIGLGVLVEPECYAPGSKIEGKTGKKPTRANMVGDAVKWWKVYANGLRTFCFASGVAHSMALRDEFREKGIPAEHVDAHTEDEERNRILKGLAVGEVQVVCNVGVMRYGVDVKEAECCQILSPMTSLVDFRQSCGRVMRSAPGKARAVVIDHAGAVSWHGFPHADLPWTLDGSDDHDEKQRQRMEKGEAPKPITCPQCFTMFSGAKICPACGWEPKAQAKAKATNAGTLTRVMDGAKPRDPAEMSRIWRRSIAIAANRGMKVSAAATMFFKDVGQWPETAGVDPLPSHRSDWSRSAAEVFPQYVRGGSRN